jgi:peptidoglycan biosynthesis protein MviN/MurJ (putative lipid II flippase)
MRLFVSLPSQQSDASIMLRLFSLNILPIVINKIFVIILNAQERRRVIVQAHLYGMFCNASLDMILFHLAQGAGIALSTALTLLLQLIVFERSYPLLRSYAQEHDVLKAFWKPALAMTIALGALSWGIDYILTYQLSPWFNISAVGVMAVAVGCIYLLSIWPFLRRMQEN